jgi:hypothetical protein
VSDEQNIALPHLYGGPAYSRPPRPVQEIPRPFDLDELPLEAERTEEDPARAGELKGNSWMPIVAEKSKPAKGRRAAGTAKSGKGASKAGGGASDGAASPAGPATGAGSSASARGNGTAHFGLQGRPFRLRGLGRIFGGDRT